MNLKKVTVISIISIFLISFLAHNLYKWIPNNLIAIFFPVNESIWEHLKMAFTSTMIYSAIKYFILKNIKHNNFGLSILASSLTTIISILIIFTPIYYLMNRQENLILTLFIYLICIIIGQIISYYILKSKKNFKTLNMLSYILIPIIFIVFGILTFNPLENNLFYDYSKNIYGIKK